MKTIANAKGFTLIELIIIIIILGILSAVAVPKYFNMKAEAEKATASGVLAALQGADNILFARKLVGGTAYTFSDVAGSVQVSGATLGGVGATGCTIRVGDNTYTVTYAANTDGTAAGTFTKSW